MKLILLFPQFLLGFVYIIQVITHANFFHIYWPILVLYWPVGNRKPALIILISSTTGHSNQWTANLSYKCLLIWMNPCCLPRLWPTVCMTCLIILAQADFLILPYTFACLTTYDRCLILPHWSVTLVADLPLISFFTLQPDPF